MFFKLLKWLKEISLFTASYSNNVFPEPLSKEEEDIYIVRASNGDKEARNKLIEHNLRLVAHIVKKFEHKNVDQDDLISIGTIGLIKGVDSYSNKHSTKITTYCARCIENEILMYFRSNNKNNKNISINESVGFDKEGNEITILDILKLPSPDFIEEIHTKDNVSLLKEYNITERKKLLMGIIFCFVYAVLDEYHQSLVPGRTSTFKDVLIDMIGVLIGYIIFISKLKKHKNNF